VTDRTHDPEALAYRILCANLPEVYKQMAFDVLAFIPIVRRNAAVEDDEEEA